MKYIITLTYLLFQFGYTHAQAFSIEWNEMQSRQGKLIYLLPSRENEFYALRWSGGDIFGSYRVSRHEDLKLVGHGRVKLQAEQSMANFEGARVINGSLVVFLSDRRDGMNHFYMQEYDDDLKPIGEPEKLASYDLDSKRSKGWFDVIMSSNEKYFGVVWEVPGRQSERDLYGFKIFDTELNVLTDGEYPLPFEPKLSTIHSHHISNNGDYFLALTEYKLDEKYKLFKNHLNYKALHIYHITDDGLQDFKLDLDGKRVEAMTMTSDTNDIFTITGIYGNMDEAGVTGVFHQCVDLKSEQTLSKGFKLFADDFITQGWSERQKKKAEKKEKKGKREVQLYNYKMRDATILEDGSIVGAMEQYYVQIRTFSDSRSGQSSNTYYYYYNDIIVYKINPSGEFDWVKKVHKYQVSANDGGPYSSFQSFINDGKIYLIFNDNIKNYSESGKFLDSEKLYTANYSRKRNTVALAEIDLVTGEVKRNTFFERSEIEALAMPKLFDVNYKTGEMLLYSIWGRKERIGVLRFNK